MQNFPPTIEAVKGWTGWYRCSITFKAAKATIFNSVYLLCTNTDNSNISTGDGVSGIAVIGAQVTNANWAGARCQTTGTPILGGIRDIVLKQNLITNSADLSTWTKSGVTIDSAETIDGIKCNKFSGINNTTFCYILSYPNMFPVGSKLSTSFLFKRISTSVVS